MSSDALQVRLARQLDKVAKKKDRALRSSAADLQRELLAATLAECGTIAARLATPEMSTALLVKARLLLLEGEIRAHLGHLDLAMLALGRAAALFHADGSPRSSALAATALLHLGRCYRQMGDHSTALSLWGSAAENIRNGEDSQLLVTYLLLTCVEADRRQELSAYLDWLAANPGVMRSSGRPVHRLSAYLDGRVDMSLRDLRQLEKQLATGFPGRPELSVLAAHAYLNRLRWHPREADEALDCLVRAIAASSAGSDLYTVARANHLAAEGFCLAGRRDEALRPALACWAAVQLNAGRTCSSRLRASARAVGSWAVAIALDCAASRQDWNLQAELLATLHLERVPGRSAAPQAMISAATPLGTELVELDLASISAPDLCLRPHHDVVDSWSAPPPATRVFVGGRSALSEAGRAHLGTAGGSGAPVDVLLEQLHRQIVGGRRDSCWWLSWVCETSVFSVVVRDGHPPVGERVKLTDHKELRRALWELASCVGTRPLTEEQNAPISTRTTFQSLRSYDSLEELELTQPLGRLVPAGIVEQLAARPAERPLDVFTCTAPELSGVPWPIVPLTPGYQARRLVEVCTLRVVALTGPESVGGPRSWDARWAAGRPPQGGTGSASCSDPTGQLRWTPLLASEISPERQSRNEVFGGATPARLTEVERFLGQFQPGQPGILVLRGVAQWDSPDPTRNGLRFPAGDVLEARQFLGTTNVSAGLRCPRLVLLSTRQPTTFPIVRGGEVVEHVTAFLAAGAHDVVFTAADVADSSFAHAFDLDIETNISNAEDPARWLRERQLRLLGQWRHFSLTMEHEPEDIRSPLPLIWGYYRVAHGVCPSPGQ